MSSLQNIEIKDFRGLQTSILDPAPNSAKSCSNVVRHRTRGMLQAQEGYTKKFADGLPANDTVLRKISAISWKDFHTFTIPDHGGKVITLAVGTYTKTGFFPASPTVGRFGVWARPYWDGAAWVDQWRELTEMFVFEVRSFSGTNRIFIDDVTRNYNFQGIAGYAGVFNSSYFLGWTMVFDQSFAEANDEKNYCLITACNFDASAPPRYYFDIFGAHADLTAAGTRAIGDKIAVYRSFVNKELPSSITSHIHSLLSEARLTSGNATTDVGLMVGFRDKSLGWATVDKEVDRLLADVSVPDVWRYAFLHDTPVLSQSSDPLPNETFYIKETLVLDDNSETELRNVLGAAAATKDAIATMLNLVLGANKVVALVDDLEVGVNDNTYHIYAALQGPTPVVYKIDPRMMSVIAGVDLSGTACSGLAYSRVIGDYLYAALDGTTNAQVTVINSLTMLTVASVALTGGTTVTAFLHAGNYIYIGYTATPGVVDVIHVPTFYYLGTVNITGSTGITSFAYDPILQNAWFGCANGKIGYAADDFSFVSNPLITPSAGADPIRALVVVGAHLYAGNSASPARICKIEMAARAEDGAYFELTTAGNNDCRALLYDGSHLFAALYTQPLKVTKIDISLWPPDAELYTLTADTGQDYATSLLNYGSALFIGAFINPGQIILLNKVSQSPITRGNVSQIDLNLLVSAGAFPPRGKAVRFYASTDDVNYYKVKEVGLYDTELTWEAAAYFHATTKHHYHKSQTVSLKGTDWANRGSLASTNIGRAITDTGIIRYSHAAVGGSRTFAVGVRISGLLEQNKVATSAQHGDGTRQWDVFPNNAVTLLDVEYNDGDQAKAVGAIMESVLILKRRSAVMLSPQNNTLFERSVVGREDGIAGVQSLSAWKDELYWVGYFGWYRFSTRYGIEIISNPIRNDWLAVSTANKEAAKGTIDIRNRMWIVTAGTKTWYYDLGRDAFVDGRSAYVDHGEIMEATFTDSPTAIKASVEGNVEFLFAGATPAIYSLAEAELHDGGDFTFHYETNRIEIPLKGRQDGLLQQFFIKYVSTIAITMKLFYNDDATEASSYVLPALQTEVRVYAPLSARCKAFRLRFEGTVSEQGSPAVTDTFKIRLSESYFEIIPAGLNNNLTA